jgi:hypothetical protein
MTRTKNNNTVSTTMQFMFCCFFFIGAVALSVQWQVATLFEPLLSVKRELVVKVNNECVEKIMNATENISTRNCLKCHLISEHKDLKKCSFSTSGAGQSKIAKSIIENHGISFNTIGYVNGESASLRYNPYPFVLLHIGIFIFGLLPLLLLSHKKGEYWS